MKKKINLLLIFVIAFFVCQGCNPKSDLDKTEQFSENSSNNNYSDKENENIEENYANKYFWVIVTFSFLGVVSLIYLFRLRYILLKTVKENINEFKNIEKRIASIENCQNRKDSLSSRSVVSSTNDMNKIEYAIRKIEKEIEELKRSKQAENQTFTHQDINKQGFVGQVKGSGDMGYFTDFNSIEFNDACYRIFNIKCDHGDFEALNLRSIMGHEQVDKAANFRGSPFVSATDIKDQTPGEVEKQNDGYWHVKTKVQINLI